jgi:hypothetical protein
LTGTTITGIIPYTRTGNVTTLSAFIQNRLDTNDRIWRKPQNYVSQQMLLNLSERESTNLVFSGTTGSQRLWWAQPASLSDKISAVHSGFFSYSAQPNTTGLTARYNSPTTLFTFNGTQYRLTAFYARQAKGATVPTKINGSSL